jgi:hypothetical protein
MVRLAPSIRRQSSFFGSFNLPGTQAKREVPHSPVIRLLLLQVEFPFVKLAILHELFGEQVFVPKEVEILNEF